MITPEWLIPGLVGAAPGDVVGAVLELASAGWVTGSKADSMARTMAAGRAMAATVPGICRPLLRPASKLARAYGGRKMPGQRWAACSGRIAAKNDCDAAANPDREAHEKARRARPWCQEKIGCPAWPAPARHGVFHADQPRMPP